MSSWLLEPTSEYFSIILCICIPVTARPNAVYVPTPAALKYPFIGFYFPIPILLSLKRARALFSLLEEATALFPSSSDESLLSLADSTDSSSNHFFSGSIPRPISSYLSLAYLSTSSRPVFTFSSHS